MKKRIKKINDLLIERFGIPKRNNSSQNPLDILIAAILSQNTTDINSFKAYKNLKSNFDNWESVTSAKLTAIEKQIRAGGLAKQKAKSIKTILMVLQKKNGQLSLDYLKNMKSDKAIEELTRFNGIGVKTASCVLLFSLNRNICPVDTHVHRTLNRIGLVKTKSPGKTFEIINENLPMGVAHSFHSNLINLGRNICKAGKPLCSICPLIKICHYDGKNIMAVSPVSENDFLLLDNV